MTDDTKVQSSKRLLTGGCCGDNLLIDFSKMEFPFEVAVDFKDSNLLISMATIVFNPLFWNVVARNEYRHRRLTKFLGSPSRGCVALGITIFLLGLYRDYRFNITLDHQPKWTALLNNWTLLTGYLCIVCGMTLVLSSFWALGFYGTFLGDYFGILMENRVTGFPFNLVNDPMYVGSTLSFIGSSLVKASQTGLILSFLVAVCYRIALSFEGPFTAEIYSKRGKLK